MRSVATVEEAVPPLDVRRVLEVLNGHGVDYLIVGGLAARLYGAERLTKDIDLVPRSDAANLDRLAGALPELVRFYGWAASVTRRPERCRRFSTWSRSLAWRSRRGAPTPVISTC